MYKYSTHNENNDISLHDCRATKILFTDNILSFLFKDGFYVCVHNKDNDKRKLSYTDMSEAKFKILYNDIIIYIFTETDDKDKAIRETISLDTLMEKINGGMELEFISVFKGYQSYIFVCWLWFDFEPYHKECEIILSADKETYYWNTIFTDDEWEGLLFTAKQRNIMSIWQNIALFLAQNDGQVRQF